VGGAVTIGVALVTNWVFPALARLDTFTDYEAAAEPARSAAEARAGGAITPDPPSALS
jgi:hypothetical protein